MTPRQMIKADQERAAKFAKWREHPQPYCVTRYDADKYRSAMFGKRRFATVDEAVDFAIRNDSRAKHGLLVDWAAAYCAA